MVKVEGIPNPFAAKFNIKSNYLNEGSTYSGP